MFSVISVCKVCLPVQAITFEPLHIEILFLVCRYIVTISRSSISIKIIGKVKVIWENYNFPYLDMLILCVWLHIINKDKVTYQDLGHINVKVKNPLSNCMSSILSMYLL